MKNTPVDYQTARKIIDGYGLPDFGKATIREVVAISTQLEQETKTEFIHMEMGVPGNSPPQVVRQEFRQQEHHPVGDGIDGGQEIIQVMMDEGIGIGFRKGRMGHKEAPFAQQNG